MFATKLFILMACTLAITMATPFNKGVMTGAPIKLTGENLKEAQNDLQVSLNNLATGDGPQLKISKVISGTVQVVSGTITKMNVDLVNANGAIMNCNAAIWSRPWLPNGIQTTVNCAGHQTMVESHSA